MRRRTLIPVSTILVVILLLAACGSAGQAMAPDAGPQDATGLAGQPSSEDESRDGGGVIDTDSGPGFFTPLDQRIIKTGEVTLEVGSVAETLGRVRSLVSELGGYVGGSQAGTLDDRATLTVRIPADRFDAALARLHELDAEVVAEVTREEEVTTQVVDLAARIDNLGASERSYRELLARAERIEDILAIQSRLDQVRGEIEQLQAQLDALEDRAALSTLTITLVPRAEPITEQAQAWDPRAQLDRALASLVGVGQGLIDGAIWFIVVWLPILLVLVIIGLLVLRGVLEVRRRVPGSHPAPPAAPAADGSGA